MGANTSVFQAFPQAIEHGWQIREMTYSTMSGNLVGEAFDIDVIVDMADASEPNQAPNIAGIIADTLVYCQPYQMPTLNPAKLVASYAVSDADGQLYAIIEAGIGKNQETGEIEHVELKIRANGASNES